MPIVPTYDNFTVSPGAAPATRFQATESPDVAGAQMRQFGQALTGAGQTLSKVAIDAQDEANKIRLTDAMNKAVAVRMRLTYDKDSGFTALKGEQALKPDADGKTVDQRYGELFGKEIDAIRESLGNDVQKQAFQAHVGSVANQFNATLQSHMLQEQETYNEGVRKGTIATAQQMGVQEYDNPESVSKARTAILNTIDSDKRMSPELKVAAKLEALSPMHAGVMAAAIESNKLEFARQYLNDFGKEMTAEATIRLKKALDVGETKVKVQTFADELMGQNLDLSAALAKTREKFSGKEEDDAVREVRERYQEKETAKTLDIKQLGVSAWSQVMKTGRLTSTMVADLEIRAPEELRQIRDWQDQKRRQAKAEAEGGSAAKDGEYYKWRRLSIDDPDAFVKLDLSKAEPYLSKGDYRHLIEVQAGLAKGDARQMESQRVFKSTISLLKADIASIGIDLTPKEGSAQAKETAMFTEALSRSLDEATKAKGSPLTDDEARRIGRGLLREGVEQGSGVLGFFQTKKRGYQIVADPNIPKESNFVAKSFGDIPKDARDALEAEYRQRNNLGNAVLNDEQRKAIERAYTRGLDAGRFK